VTWPPISGWTFACRSFWIPGKDSLGYCTYLPTYI